MNHSLVEPGVKYFFKETLKQCNEYKFEYYNSLYNVILFAILSIILFTIFVYNYKNKETSYQRREKLRMQEEYLASKIHRLKQEKQRERGQMITNIPEFESSDHIQTKKFL